jgi:hypothetical protein
MNNSTAQPIVSSLHAKATDAKDNASFQVGCNLGEATLVLMVFGGGSEFSLTRRLNKQLFILLHVTGFVNTKIMKSHSRLLSHMPWASGLMSRPILHVCTVSS